MIDFVIIVISVAAVLLFLALLSMLLGPVCAMIWPRYVGSWYLSKELKKRNVDIPNECVDKLSEICTICYKNGIKTKRGMAKFFGLARQLDIMLDDVDAYVFRGQDQEWSVAGPILEDYGVKPRADIPTKTQLMELEFEKLFTQEVLLFQNHAAASGMLKGHFEAKNDTAMLRRLENIREANMLVRKRTMPGQLANTADTQALADMNFELRKLYDENVFVTTERIRKALGSADHRFSRTFDDVHVPMLGWDAHMERLRSMSDP
jgi:hypothetical protein